MDTKIQELTEKIYQEGVEKGNKEAESIIAEANAKKQSILNEAEAEAKKILANAEKQISEAKKNADAELKIAANHLIESLKKEIVNLLAGKITDASIKPVIADKEFIRSVILEMSKSWAKNEALIIQTSDAQELQKYFEGNAKELLNKGLRIENVAGKDTSSFTIQLADGSYKVNFGDEEFVLFFKELLRPQLVEKLF